MLQGEGNNPVILLSVSIPLKSGRCCKFGWANRCDARKVSIPLKSGRCCKSIRPEDIWKLKSQSLWSQGGAASFNFYFCYGIFVSIPLKSGRCCKAESLQGVGNPEVSIPLKSGRCCKMFMWHNNQVFLSQSLWSQGGAASPQGLWQCQLPCLNPFEVREVLQAKNHFVPTWIGCLNPFEVREVLQASYTRKPTTTTSLNPFEVREVLQGSQCIQGKTCCVSIPLKSGRCCKKMKYFIMWV